MVRVRKREIDEVVDPKVGRKAQKRLRVLVVVRVIEAIERDSGAKGQIIRYRLRVRLTNDNICFTMSNFKIQFK